MMLDFRRDPNPFSSPMDAVTPNDVEGPDLDEICLNGRLDSKFTFLCQELPTRLDLREIYHHKLMEYVNVDFVRTQKCALRTQDVL